MSPSGITAVSTDGHRLVKYTRRDHSSDSFSGELIIPKKFLTYMGSHLTEEVVQISVAENFIGAKIGNDKVFFRDSIALSESYEKFYEYLESINSKIEYFLI